jgi:hypothetical protein
MVTMRNDSPRRLVIARDAALTAAAALFCAVVVYGWIAAHRLEKAISDVSTAQPATPTPAGGTYTPDCGGG